MTDEGGEESPGREREPLSDHYCSVVVSNYNNMYMTEERNRERTLIHVTST